MTDAEINALAETEEPAPLTDAQINALSAAETAPPPKPPEPPKPPPGFVRRGLNSIEHGAGAVKHSFGTLLHQAGQRALGAVGLKHELPPSPEQGGAQRREMLRGVDDITTLGYGQRLAARVGNALGDTPENSLDEGRHFSADPLQGDINTRFSTRQARDAQLAPEFREGAQFATAASPFIANPVSEGLAVTGEALLPRVARIVPARAITLAKKLPAVVTAPAKAAANYAVSAGTQAGLSANAEGHRMEAVGQAVTDPGGWLATLVASGVLGPIRGAVLNSSGAQKRAYNEKHGNIRTGLFTAGKGGVLNDQLAGVPYNDAGVGQAEAIAANNVMNKLEGDFQREQGYPYRGGKALVRDATEASKEAGAHSKAAIAAAIEERKVLEKATKRENLVETAHRANQVVGDLEAERRAKASDPYEALVEKIPPEALAKKRDFTHVVEAMRKAATSAKTPREVRAKLKDDLDLVEQFAEAPGPAAAEPAPVVPRRHLEELREARATAKGANAEYLDKVIADELAAAAPPPPEAPRGMRYMAPEDELNGFRANLMGQAGIGKSDRRKASETPLRHAAFLIKEMTDTGPMAEPNRVFHEGASGVETKRLGVGLKRQPSADRAAEVKGVKKALREALNDPTALPGELAGNIPEAANVQPLRDRIAAAERSAIPTIEAARAERGAAQEAVKTARERRAAGDAAALEDRRLLGLNEQIGQRKQDINIAGLNMGSASTNSRAAGRRARAGIPAGEPELGAPATGTNIPAFRLKYPGLETDTRLPDLLSNRLDLQWQFGTPSHGGFHGRIGKSAIINMLKANVDPFNARVLHTPAKLADPTAIAGALGIYRGANIGEKKDPAAIAKALGVARGASLGQKAEAYIELQKQEQGQ